MRKQINYISILLVLIYVFNSDVCDFFYKNLIFDFRLKWPQIADFYNPYNTLWWIMRGKIYALVFGVSFYASTLDKTRFSEFIFKIGVGFAGADLVSRCVFEETTRNIIECAIAAATTYWAIYKYIKTNKNATT